MRFPVVSDTRSGGCTDILQPGREVAERGDVLEAAVGERGAVEALRRGQPADLAVEPVVVVVASEFSKCRLGVGQRAEDLAIKHLALERRPERLDLPVGPGRVDLRLDLADLKLAQGLPKPTQHPGHPVHELGPVVAHEIERPTAQLDAVAQPDEDRGDLPAAGDPQPENVAGVVIDQAIDPGLEVPVLGQLDEERAFDVDVPERIWARALIAWPALAWPGGPARAEVVEESLDPAVAHERDLAPAELGGDAFGVPVRVQAHRDDHLLDPGGMLEHAASWSKPLRDECGQPAALVRLLPAPKRHAAAGPELERRGQIVCASGPQDAGTLPNHAEVAAGPLRSGRTTA